MGVPIQKILPPSSLVRPTRHEIVEYGLLHVVRERLIHLQRERRTHDRMQATDDGHGGSRPSTRVQLDEGAIPGGRQYVDSRLRRDGKVEDGTRQKLQVEISAQVDGEDVSPGRSCRWPDKSRCHIRQGNIGQAGRSWRLKKVQCRGQRR
ncbi:hypothetical protein C8R44DRAFT_768242 [Mycena epipterygia]|nr:hypothetical protein C8R44DRAFT_768242 [Mycena epipterygia]